MTKMMVMMMIGWHGQAYTGIFLLEGSYLGIFRELDD